MKKCLWPNNVIDDSTAKNFVFFHMGISLVNILFMKTKKYKKKLF